MSFKNDYLIPSTLRQAADALGLIDACRNHRLPKDSGKHRLLVATMRDASERLKRLVTGQSAYEHNEFFRLAMEIAQEKREEQKRISKAARELREEREAERQAALLMLAA